MANAHTPRVTQHSEATLSEVIRMHAAGCTDTEIAARVGIARSQVSAILENPPTRDRYLAHRGLIP